MSNNLHVLGVAHTIPHEDYLVCAFTAKVLLFPEVIQPFGWDVIEYSNEGSASKAREHVVILRKERLQALSRRRSREEPLDADVGNTGLTSEFQRVLLEKIGSRAKPGDIVCHVWGPNMEVYDLLRDCRHIELCVGYTASPGLPFRVYESSAWMHWHYGKAGQEDGNNYKWVVPSPIDTDRWTFREDPNDYALFFGRVTQRKGMDTLIEIARRMPTLRILVYGPGDPSPWAKEAPPNLVFKGPVFGDERVNVVQRARCMLMPTVFIEPFGNSHIEAQLCGVPVIAVSFGAFHETVVEGVTGYRCHTLADWVEAIRLSRSLDRRQIATLARGKYSKEVVGKQYDWVLKQLADLSDRGWYAEKSRKFASAVVFPQEDTPRKPRIRLYMPYFGAFPNYFQLYLDSLGKNADCLSVFLMTDNDLSGYRVPDNLIPIQLTLGALREKAARFINDEFRINAQPDALLKQPHKLCDFRIMYAELFRDVSEQYGVTDDDFVGWGDCDLIYGRFSDFLDMKEDYHIIGGFHGHFTAFRNIDSFRKLFKAVEGLPELLLEETPRVVDEIVFRKILLDFLDGNGYRMFYINRYFCDIAPECFFGLFRQDHAERKKNFFDVYHPNKEIAYVHYDRDGRLTVAYEDGDSRQSIYCHLQKRSMSLDFDRHENGYYICEDAFSLEPPVSRPILPGSPNEGRSTPGAAVPVEFKDQHGLDPTLANYLAKPGPHCLEIGAGWNSRPGWLATDLNPPPGHACIRLDATKGFDIPSESFDFVYSEHMIEHVSFDDGRNMLEECNRILKPSGVIRIVTPSLGFLSRVMSSNRGMLEDRYRNWSVTTWVPEAPQVTNAFFLNNFVRQWGHTFIYDRETLELALRLSGFEPVVSCELNNSEHPLLCGLANVGKIPPGFLDLESMVLEGAKARSVAAPIPRGRNLALGKRATQSSISPWSLEANPESEAARVVSGHFTGSYNCHTGLDSPPWWRVDLDEIQQISEVRIYNRVSQNQAILARASRLEIQVSNEDQTWKTVFCKETSTLLRGPTRRSPFIWIPEEQVSGRYVRIQLLDKQYLHLEQVEIYGP